MATSWSSVPAFARIIGAVAGLAFLAEVACGAWMLASNSLGDEAGTRVLMVAGTAVVACGVLAIVGGLVALCSRPDRRSRAVAAIAVGFGACIAAASVPAAMVVSIIGYGIMHMGAGAAWGRPLRVRGRQLHPELRLGSDWTDGERPDPVELDPATRRALEALWLHDAQKEHASVPAFARISWLLAAVGAPAELTAWCHRAALEEIDHARRCFALAAGYGGRSHSVDAMPDLLLGGLDGVRDPLATLAFESIEDGCQLEDFNADVAACAAACEEPATRAVLERIAREERSHAEFSWSLLGWLLEAHGARVRPSLGDDALRRLARIRQPTSASATLAPLVAAADADALRRHGRLTDREWARLWDARMAATRARLGELLEPVPA